MKERKHLLVAGLLLVAAVAAFVVVRSGGGARSSPALHVVVPERAPVAHYSAGHNQTMDRLQNRLPRKANWDTDDAAFLRELMRTPLPDFQSMEANSLETPLDERIAMAAALEKQSMSVSIAAEALRLGHPVTVEARAIIEEELLAQLQHEDRRARLAAVQAVVYSRMVEDSVIRRTIERMRVDPDPAIAANAERQLRHYDRLKAADEGRRGRLADCPTCPKPG